MLEQIYTIPIALLPSPMIGTPPDFAAPPMRALYVPVIFPLGLGPYTKLGHTMYVATSPLDPASRTAMSTSPCIRSGEIDFMDSSSPSYMTKESSNIHHPLHLERV